MSGSYSWPLMIPFCTWVSRNPLIPTNMLPLSFNPNCSQQLIPIPEINFFVLKCQQNHKGLLEKNYLTASHVVLSGSVNIFKLKLKTLLILNMHLCVDFLLFISPVILQVKPVIFIDCYHLLLLIDNFTFNVHHRFLLYCFISCDCQRRKTFMLTAVLDS